MDFVLGLLAHGASYEEILDEYHGLARDDILACLAFAAHSLADTRFLPLTAESA